MFYKYNKFLFYVWWYGLNFKFLKFVFKLTRGDIKFCINLYISIMLVVFFPINVQRVMVSSFVFTRLNEERKVFIYNYLINNKAYIIGINKFINNSNFLRKLHKSDIKLLKPKYDGNLLNFILSNHSWSYIEKYKKTET